MKVLFLLMLATGDKLPDGPGKVTVERVCGACHQADIVVSMRLDRRGWKDLVNVMMDEGAIATPREQKEIVNYLAKRYKKN